MLSVIEDYKTWVRPLALYATLVQSYTPLPVIHVHSCPRQLGWESMLTQFAGSLLQPIEN